ncbi:MAG: FAD-dependent oxidoreductase, partial [Blautia sp.]|nr:FAD-dependent oxidoreductase [Blautia sp.]
ATGSSPFVPPMNGLDSVEDKFSFMTLDDALSLESALTPSSRVFIIGAGLIGLKCAEGIYERVDSITVCDLAGRVLSSILDDECALMVQQTLEEKGLTFLLGDSVDHFEGKKAFLKSGREVDFDILVLAVGVRANTSLIKDAGGEVGRGIVVDEHMHTSLPHIYAAGDCAEGFDLSLGGRRVLAVLPNASLQGFTAGVNMAGHKEAFDKGIPMNSIGFFGLHAMTAGTYEGECFEEKGEGFIRRLYYQDDRLKGFILIGVQERAGIYTSLIREKTPLSSINFDLMKKAATTVAFSPEVRVRKFGGVV